MELTKVFLKTLLLLFVALSFLSSKVRSADVFFDDFENGNLDKWEFVQGQGGYDNTWYISGGWLHGDIAYQGSSFLFSKIGSTLIDYSIKADVISMNGVDQDFVFNINNSRSSYYLANFRYNCPTWSDSNMVRLWKFENGSYTKVGEVAPADLGNSFILSQGVTHVVQIDSKSNEIKLFFDGVLVIGTTLGVSTGGSYGIGLRNWAGSYNSYIYGNVLNKFDNIRVTSTAVPPFSRNKIFIIPGLGASWEERAMVLNQQIDDNDWRMTPFVKNYNGLIAALEAKGLVKGTDFWVWNYDWRRPVGEISDKFDTFVESKLSAGEKADVVGHSLGGLVGRIWSQKETEEGGGRLGKIVSLGSPQSGAVKAYEAWSGAKISDNTDLSSIALSVLLQLQKKNFESEVATIRNYAPVLKDLLPVFNFVRKNGTALPWENLESKNQYLMTRNLTISSIFEKFKAIVAVGYRTKEWVNLVDRSVFDRVLGVWPDGKIVSYVMGEGDGTVLKKSAKFDGDAFDETSSNHGDMVNRSVDKIFGELGLGSASVINDPGTDLSNLLIFYVGSPAEMTVSCGLGDTAVDTEGWVALKNNNYNDCTVNLNGTDNGTYHLVTGKTFGDNGWKYYEGEIGTGQIKRLIVDVGSGSLVLNDENRDYLLGLIKEDLFLLKQQYGESVFLNKALAAADDKNIDELTSNIFSFRKDKRESKVTGRILSNLETVLMIKNKSCSKQEAWVSFIRAVSERSGVERMTRLYGRNGTAPSGFGSLSYRKLEELMEKAERSRGNMDWPGMWAQTTLSSRLAREIW